MSQVELRIESILVGAARRWALYAIPCAEEDEVERAECHSLGELDGLLTKLKKNGVIDSALLKARAVLVERNVLYVLKQHKTGFLAGFGLLSKGWRSQRQDLPVRRD
jgi:hypothetical protein